MTQSVTIPNLSLPTGAAIPKLGLGTWYMGERHAEFDAEVQAVRYAIERGIRLIDTAEMYAAGGAEDVVGAAVRASDVDRSELFLVSKVLPSNARRSATIQACEDSLSRLGTEYLDLYLLHWRGGVPFAETLEAFLALQAAGKIRAFGVSNFDAEDLAEWCDLDGAGQTACNQILYNLKRRGPEWDLLPACARRGIPVMAYSPLEQSRLDRHPALTKVANRHGVTPLQVALAWVLAQENVLAIPKSVRPAHIDQNIAALDMRLDEDDLATLTAAFPPPSGPSPLDML